MLLVRMLEMQFTEMRLGSPDKVLEADDLALVSEKHEGN